MIQAHVQEEHAHSNAHTQTHTDAQVKHATKQAFCRRCWIPSSPLAVQVAASCCFHAPAAFTRCRRCRCHRKFQYQHNFRRRRRCRGCDYCRRRSRSHHHRVRPPTPLPQSPPRPIKRPLCEERRDRTVSGGPQRAALAARAWS